MDKFKMELTWHSCQTCPPEEDYNPCLYVTDGKTIFPMRWKKDNEWQRFECGTWYIEKDVNAPNFWWADLNQTIRETKEFKEMI